MYKMETNNHLMYLIMSKWHNYDMIIIIIKFRLMYYKIILMNNQKKY